MIDEVYVTKPKPKINISKTKENPSMKVYLVIDPHDHAL
jgi:hypothetical protein